MLITKVQGVEVSASAKSGSSAFDFMQFGDASLPEKSQAAKLIKLMAAQKQGGREHSADALSATTR